MSTTTIGHPKALRFDFQALLAYCYQTIQPGLEDYEGRTEAAIEAQPLAYSTIARLLGMNRSEVARLAAGGTINVVQADLYATRLGRHPVELWPTFHDELGDEELDLEGW